LLQYGLLLSSAQQANRTSCGQLFAKFLKLLQFVDDWAIIVYKKGLKTVNVQLLDRSLTYRVLVWVPERTFCEISF
jgi:hypothetical protein